MYLMQKKCRMQAKKVLKFLTLFADNVYIDYNKKEIKTRKEENDESPYTRTN